MTACKRCGREDGTHIGFHEDDELPVKKGQRVRLKVGALIRTTHPTNKELINKRSRVVAVLSVHNGMSQHIGYTDDGNNIWRHIDEPYVLWSGTGGYWHRTAMSNVEVVP